MVLKHAKIVGMLLRAVGFLVVGLALGAIVVEAQGGPDRIGLVGPPEEPRFSEVRDGLERGLRDQGYADGAIAVLEARIAREEQETVRAAVEGFLQQGVKALVVIGSRLAQLARPVSADLPIIYITPGDPVSHGLAASLSRPGGNTTAMTLEYPELTGKRLQLLKELLPRVRRVMILYDPRDGSPRLGAAAAREAAARLGLALVEREVRSRADIGRGLQALGEADAFLAIPGGLPTGHYAEIIHAANSKRIPTMFHGRTGSTTAALASYGASDAAIARQLARHVAKVLQGTKAGELPVERPMALELVVNLSTAQQIGVTIPPEVLIRVDRVLH